MKENLTCSVCGTKMTKENAVEFDGQTICNVCIDEKTALCDCCGERIWIHTQIVKQLFANIVMTAITQDARIADAS